MLPRNRPSTDRSSGLLAAVVFLSVFAGCGGPSASERAAAELLKVEQLASGSADDDSPLQFRALGGSAQCRATDERTSTQKRVYACDRTADLDGETTKLKLTLQDDGNLGLLDNEAGGQGRPPADNEQAGRYTAKRFGVDPEQKTFVRCVDGDDQATNLTTYECALQTDYGRPPLKVVQAQTYGRAASGVEGPEGVEVLYRWYPDGTLAANAFSGIVGLPDRPDEDFHEAVGIAAGSDPDDSDVETVPPLTGGDGSEHEGLSTPSGGFGTSPDAGVDQTGGTADVDGETCVTGEDPTPYAFVSADGEGCDLARASQDEFWGMLQYVEPEQEEVVFQTADSTRVTCRLSDAGAEAEGTIATCSSVGIDEFTVVGRDSATP